ncbi:Hint domain-containing protein [Actinoplanes sp. NPDC020271]|uniref:Hint domain-containing protein n=1 Tax=Actinoplanes sp. NPDC020271 TaxID=3363896 RepID=UPI0037A2AB92
MATIAASVALGPVGGMVAGIAINLVKDAASGNIHSLSDLGSSLASSAVSATIGLVTGGLGGAIGGKIAGYAACKLGAGLAGKMITGAISGGIGGGISDAAEQLATTGHVNWAQTANATKTGAIIGAVTGGATRCHSFDPSTQVLMADGSTKKIAEVKLGDKVLATDPKTGQTDGEQVSVLHHHEDSDFADVTVKDDKTGKTSVVKATANHPFWNATTQEWTEAKDLKAGDKLRNADGETTQTVAAIKVWTGLKWMDDLTVNYIHTYYVLVGDTPALVHNCGKDGELNPSALRQRVDALERQLGAGASRRTASGLHVVEGVDLFAVGARSNISEKGINLLDDGDEALRIYPGLPSPKVDPHLLGRDHAEGKVLTEAVGMGVEPKMLIASRPFCDEYCAPLIERLGGRILTRTRAKWGEVVMSEFPAPTSAPSAELALTVATADRVTTGLATFLEALEKPYSTDTFNPQQAVSMKWQELNGFGAVASLVQELNTELPVTRQRIMASGRTGSLIAAAAMDVISGILDDESDELDRLSGVVGSAFKVAMEMDRSHVVPPAGHTSWAAFEFASQVEVVNFLSGINGRYSLENIDELRMQAGGQGLAYHRGMKDLVRP